MHLHFQRQPRQQYSNRKINYKCNWFELVHILNTRSQTIKVHSMSMRLIIIITITVIVFSSSFFMVQKCTIRCLFVATAAVITADVVLLWFFFCSVLFCCRPLSFFGVVRHSYFVRSLFVLFVSSSSFLFSCQRSIIHVSMYACEFVHVWLSYEAHCSFNTRTQNMRTEKRREEKKNRNTLTCRALCECVCAYVHLYCMISIILSHC